MQIFGPAIVALLLPLSAMWASANVANTQASSRNRMACCGIPFGRGVLDNKAQKGKHTSTSNDSDTPTSSPTKYTECGEAARRDLEIGMI